MKNTLILMCYVQVISRDSENVKLPHFRAYPWGQGMVDLPTLSKSQLNAGKYAIH